MVISQYYNDKHDALYLNNSKQFNKYLYLLLHNNHYYVIKSMKAYLKKSYFCDECKIGYRNLSRHKCSSICASCCRKITECKLVSQRVCGFVNENIKCSITARNDDCYQMHKTKYCCELTCCLKCGAFKNNKHVCDDFHRWCNNCNKTVEMNHFCFIKKESAEELIKKAEKLSSLITFDFEAYSDEVTNNHIVNLAIAKKTCPNCLDIENETDRCEDCQRVHVFKNVDEFCTWSLEQTNSIQIAHNLRGYDGIFIMQNFLKNKLPTDSKCGPKIIPNGSKIMCIEWKSIKIIDSFLFIPASLESFSKAFSIDNLVKGFFPHKFNKPENFNYVGPYPDVSYYEIDFMSPAKRENFMLWYNSVCHQEFDFQKEFNKYCLSDVNLLTEGVLKFRN